MGSTMGEGRWTDETGCLVGGSWDMDWIWIWICNMDMDMDDSGGVMGVHGVGRAGEDGKIRQRCDAFSNGVYILLGTLAATHAACSVSIFDITINSLKLALIRAKAVIGFCARVMHRLSRSRRDALSMLR